MSAPVHPYTARPFDEASVQLAVSGRSVHLTPADRRETIRRLAPIHESPAIAALLGISRRTVDRAKEALR